MEKFHIAGLNETYKMMDELTSKEKQKIILSVLKDAANRNIKSKLEGGNRYGKSKSRKKKPFITTIDRKNPLGIISGVSGDYFHYRFIEFGTRQRFTRSFKTKTRYAFGRKYKTKTQKKVLSRGFMRSKPFLTKIIEGNIPNVINYFVENFGAKVKKLMDRLARKKQ